MGFYGNITYNTYGIQEKSIKPEHLDREYWNIKDKRKIKSEQEFRNFLGFEKVNETRWNEIQELKNETIDEEELNRLKKEEELIQQTWNTALINSKKSLFKFHFHPSFSIAQNLYGSGMLIGFVRETEAGHSLYFISLGGRTGQIFTYKLELGTTPITSINDDVLEYDDVDVNEDDAINYMLSNTITTSQLKDKAITKDKIYDGAVVTDKIYDGAVVTDKIDNEAVIPEKLDREYLEKIMVWGDEKITTWTQFCNKVKFIGTQSDMSHSGNGLYFFLRIDANLPSKYNHLKDSADGNIQRAMVWAASRNNYFILDFQYGRHWNVLVNTTTSDASRVVEENGIRYKITLLETIQDQIADLSINESKIAQNAITNDKIRSGAIKPDRFDRHYLEKNIVWLEKDEIPNWKEFFKKQKFIGTNYKEGEHEQGGSLTFFLTFEAKMPSKFGGGYKTFNRVMSWCSSGYNENEGTGTAFFIAFGNNPIEIWSVSGIKKNKIADEKDKDDVVAVEEAGKETAYFKLWTTKEYNMNEITGASGDSDIISILTQSKDGQKVDFIYNNDYLEGIVMSTPSEIKASIGTHYLDKCIYYTDFKNKFTGWLYVSNQSGNNHVKQLPASPQRAQPHPKTFITTVADSGKHPDNFCTNIGDILVYDSGSYNTSTVKICVNKNNGVPTWYKLQISGV